MRIFLWILAILSVLALTLWLSFDRLATRGIGYLLAKSNIPVQSYRIEKLTREHVVLADVALGEAGEVKARSLDLRIGWKGRSAQQFDVVATGVEVAARLEGGAVALGGVERAWQESSAPATGEVTDIHATGDLTAQYRMGGALTITARDTTITATRDGVALLMPVRANAELSGDVAKALTYKGTLSAAKEKLQATFNGAFDVATAGGKTEWSIRPVRFTPDGLTFAEVSPFYAAELPTFPMRVSAKGTLVLTKGSWSLAPNVTFHELPLETLLAGVLGTDAKVQGVVAGGVPLRLSPGKWRIDPASLSNKGGLSIAVSPVGAAADMLKTHPQSGIVLGALGNFQVEAMTLDVKSTDDQGGVHLGWHFLGANPDLYGGKKIDFTLAVNANVEDIWLSATQAEKLAEKASAQGAKQ